MGIDQNLDLLKSHEHNPTQNFLETNLDHSLLPTITWPTRIMKSTVTLIDNISFFKLITKWISIMHYVE